MIEEPAGDRRALAGAFLDLEEERREVEVQAVEPDEIQGFGRSDEDRNMSIRDAFAIGGAFPFVLLTMLNSFDEFESAAMGTLAPNIRDSLGIGDGTMVLIGSASSAFLILGAIPMGYLADRLRRAPIIAWSSIIFSVMVAASGAAVNAFMLLMTRLGAGVAKANTLPVHGSYMADRYPIATRGRMSALNGLIGRAVATCSPLLVGAIAAIVGGDDGWRWSFFLLSIPVGVVAFVAFRLPEPPRGQFEQQSITGTVDEDLDPAPISMEAAFARIKKIKTMMAAIAAFSVIGFGLFTMPIVANLWLEDHFELGTFGRGAVGTTSGVAVLASLPFIGRWYDRTYQADPRRAARLSCWVLLPTAVIVPIQYFMPNPVAFAIVGMIPAVLTTAAFSMVGPLLALVIPYRLRGLGSAIGSIYMFFIGALGGAVLSSLMIDAWGPRTTVLVIYIPATIIGAFLLYRGSYSILDDMASNAAEIQDEADEAERRRADPDSVPAIQISHVDFSYGPVQVLFDVSFEVRKGEVLALLGTNSAGKSTALKVISGLEAPTRGVVRHHGRTITFSSPESRTRMGIRMLPGGKGVFPGLTVRENLQMATYNQRRDPADAEARIARALELFPEIAPRLDEPATSLSGGQQQMLALARVLTDDPDVLMIDELSLGLAPILVERMVKVIEQLRDEGMTIVIVEQSLNVASTIAERAVFLEKGHVRFEGDMQTLLERDDLARAVFLGEDGG